MKIMVVKMMLGLWIWVKNEVKMIENRIRGGDKRKG